MTVITMIQGIGPAHNDGGLEWMGAIASECIATTGKKQCREENVIGNNALVRGRVTSRVG
jgi:hypothetical protein